jgi:hypothetical protein
MCIGVFEDLLWACFLSALTVSCRKKAVHLRLDIEALLQFVVNLFWVRWLFSGVVHGSCSLVLASFQKFFIYVFLYFGPKHVFPLSPYHSSCTGHPLF